MTGQPWAFGIDRASLEQSTCDLIHRTMTYAVIPGFPRNRISIVSQGAGRPSRPRPFISVMISSPVDSPRAGENARYWPTFEQWQVQFTDSSDGPYTLTVQGIDYTVNAVGLTVTELRDAMLAELGVNLNWTATAQGADSIHFLASTKGDMLMVLPSPETVQASRVVKNFYKRGFIPALLQVNIQCWGLMSIQAPAAVQSGPSIAENMRSAFLDVDLNQAIRDCGFAPITARVIDGADIINQQTNSDATCQVVMKAMARMDVQAGSGTEITTTPTVTGA